MARTNECSEPQQQPENAKSLTCSSQRSIEF